MSEQNAPSRYVQTRLSETQKARILGNVLSQSPTRSAGSQVRALALVAVVLLSLGVGVWVKRSATKVPIASETSRWHTTGDVQNKTIVLRGQELRLGPATQLLVVDEEKALVRLERGSVSCLPSDGASENSIAVEAGDALIDCGKAAMTAFLEMEEAGPVLQVTATGSTVRIVRHGNVRLLSPGETWTSGPPSELKKTEVAEVVEHQKSAEPELSAPVEPQLETKESAQQTWLKAQDARLAGHPDQAARLLARLVSQFPQDPRAGLAAFELGRLRLDQLGDPAGALQAFNLALQQGNGAFFMEDAAAGRVTALSRLGDPKRCRPARDRFLSRYPQSPHRKRLKELCRTD